MRILLAPMEGLLDYMLRDTLTRVSATASDSCANGGIDVCVAEFIRITNTLLPARSFYCVVPELKNQCRTPARVPVRIQILGSDPICMAENAAKLANLGAFGIDLNFGCPAKTVNRHRGAIKRAGIVVRHRACRAQSASCQRAPYRQEAPGV
jgi:tRNA-dihydrouridine synthase C